MVDFANWPSGIGMNSCASDVQSSRTRDRMWAASSKAIVWVMDGRAASLMMFACSP
ncbi:hypothetical protein D3C87_2137210 [compost metagenome]